MNRFVLSFALIGLPFAAAHAADYPQGTIFDKRIQYVTYSSEDVVVIKTRLGTATVIQLEKGENLESGDAALAIGDKEAWAIAVRGSNIIIKPVDEFPQTNINVITNKRTYAFDLVEASSKKDVSYFVRFRYPTYETKEERRAREALESRMPCSDGPRNFSYFKYGDDDLAPSKVWDDGKFTCFEYPNNKPIPAIYKYVPGTELKEALIDFHVREDVLIAQTTAEEFRLRLGDKVLGIKTDNLGNIPFNTNRTATGQKREVISDE